MNYRIVYRDEAKHEAAEAAGYIADQGSLDKALHWFDGLEAAIASLEEMPRRFGFAREHVLRRTPELRQMPYKSHRVIFAIIGSEVHVLHVRHTAQDNVDRTDLDPPETDKPA